MSLKESPTPPSIPTPTPQTKTQAPPEEPDIEPNQFKPTYIILTLFAITTIIFVILVFFTDLL